MSDLLDAEHDQGLRASCALFGQMLHNSPEGWAYLHQREVNATLIERYGLGMGLWGYSAILVNWGVSPAVQHALGLLDDKGAETMGDRIMFPWLSPSGKHVIGIGGRSIRDGERRPKYDNTPHQPWFAKGRAVFGLAQSAAAIHQAGWVLIEEGPFDAMASARLGYTNAVATVGAKVTLDQLLLVSRLTNHAVVMLDEDEGGRRGREAVLELVHKHWMPSGFQVSTATLRGVKDVASPGCTVEHIEAALAGALPVHK